MGLGNVFLVEQFIENEAMLDQAFPERLLTVFRLKYLQKHRDGARSDELFLEMVSFAEQGHRSTLDRAAALTVLVYFFWKCDLFEKTLPI